MPKPFQHLRFNLVTKLILSVGLTLLLSISTWAYFNIKYQTQKIMKDIMIATDRLSNTIILGAHYAMMLNSREDINNIIKNVSKQKEIDTIRIYNIKTLDDKVDPVRVGLAEAAPGEDFNRIVSRALQEAVSQGDGTEATENPA